MIQKIKPHKVIADKTYDADWLLYYLNSENIVAVIPPKRSRLQQRTIDYKSYKERNVIERTINKLKQHRRIAPAMKRLQPLFFPSAFWLQLLSICLFRC